MPGTWDEYYSGVDLWHVVGEIYNASVLRNDCKNEMAWTSEAFVELREHSKDTRKECRCLHVRDAACLEILTTS